MENKWFMFLITAIITVYYIFTMEVKNIREGIVKSRARKTIQVARQSRMKIISYVLADLFHIAVSFDIADLFHIACSLYIVIQSGSVALPSQTSL